LSLEPSVPPVTAVLDGAILLSGTQPVKRDWVPSRNRIGLQSYKERFFSVRLIASTPCRMRKRPRGFGRLEPATHRVVATWANNNPAPAEDRTDVVGRQRLATPPISVWGPRDLGLRRAPGLHSRPEVARNPTRPTWQYDAALEFRSDEAFARASRPVSGRRRKTRNPLGRRMLAHGNERRL